jgi:hypothetical protein
VAVSLQAEEPIWIGRKMDAVGAKLAAFLKLENIVPYPDHYVGSSERHPMQFVAEEITRHKWDKGTIGVETDDLLLYRPIGRPAQVGPSQCAFCRRLPPGQLVLDEKIRARDRIHAPSREDRGCRKVKPGVTCEELAATWKMTTTKYAIEKDSRIGYPVGVGYPPTWGELTVSIRAGDKTVLEEGQKLVRRWPLGWPGLPKQPRD